MLFLSCRTRVSIIICPNYILSTEGQKRCFNNHLCTFPSGSFTVHNFSSCFASEIQPGTEARPRRGSQSGRWRWCTSQGRRGSSKYGAKCVQEKRSGAFIARLKHAGETNRDVLFWQASSGNGRFRFWCLASFPGAFARALQQQGTTSLNV